MNRLLSILATLALALLAGLGGYFFHISFWGTTILAFFFEVIGFYAFYSWLITKTKVELEHVYAAQLQAMAQQTIQVKCSYCKHQQYFPVRLDQENELKCEKCSKLNSVFISIETAQKTTPVDIGPAIIPPKVLDELAKHALEENKKNASTTK